MNRLDEIEREVTPRTQWQTSTSIKLVDLAALVAVARAAQRLQCMDTSIEDDIDAIEAALAPLLADSAQPICKITGKPQWSHCGAMPCKCLRTSADAGEGR